MGEHNRCMFSSPRWKDGATSVLVSRILDNIGYGLPMVRLRQYYFKHFIENEPNETVTTILSGSKAEGLCKPFESDFDLLITSSEFICTTIPQSFVSTYQHTIFQMDIADTSPGYARLLHDGPVFDGEIESIMYSIAGLAYLRSDKWRTMEKQFLSEDSEIKISLEFSGPSCPISFFHKDLHLQVPSDIVAGIICDCPDIIQPWMDRQRNDFPSDDVIRDISNMETVAVPVGYKQSEWQFLEWRICFTKAEIRLVQSLNDCQTKLLILLKKIANLCLKPICKEITSYLMKNIVLWMSEQILENYFIEENLFQALETSLKLLRSCLIRKQLPSYMMSDRNLLSGRVTVYERSELCREIDSLLREGPWVVLRWNHVSSALNRLYCSPDTYCNLSKLYFLIDLSGLLSMNFQVSPLENLQLQSKLAATTVETLLSIYPELRNNLSEQLLRNIIKVFLS